MNEDLEGLTNWENRFKKLFFDNGETPVGLLEQCAYSALEWLKIYSPLNPNYGKEQEL